MFWAASCLQAVEYGKKCHRHFESKHKTDLRRKAEIEIADLLGLSSAGDITPCFSQAFQKHLAVWNGVRW